MPRHIKIMSDEPAIIDGESVTKITGRPGDLLRLLVLRDGHMVRRETIAELHGDSPDSGMSRAAGKVRDLRTLLAGHADLIVNDKGNGYHFAANNCVIDSRDFKKVVEQVDVRFEVESTHEVGEADARQAVERIKSALSMWDVNPGAGIGFERRFTELKSKADRCLIKARLLTKDPGEIREAVLELEAVSRRPLEAEEWVWRLLLLAYDASWNIGQVDHVLQRISEHYKGQVPPKLRDLMLSVRAGHGYVNPFRPASSREVAPPKGPTPAPERLNADDTALHKLCSTLGITTKSQLRLEGSQLDPLECIARTRTRLFFSGVLASKWVNERAVRHKFKELLKRLDANGGEAKFLMIDTSGEAYRRLLELRDGQLNLDSVAHLRELMETHRSLEVRAYDSLPAFRLVVIDDDVVSFSPYRLAAAAYKTTDRGWEAPHVALDPLAPYPLAEAFELLFHETWRNAKPLRDIR